MAHLTWLASELRAAGLTVVEVDGWKTRGSDTFAPVGVTWHATAGSRTSTARGEVNVLLHGSESAPPPIAQLMIWRDGTVYVVAAGRCNHNKVGWAGLNKGLGNRQLFGIECANDNRGEPWPAAQLGSLRLATAVIMRHLKADPMKRLAAHYEHQPAAGRPAGETSTKTDPHGVVMTKERPAVAAIMKGDDDMPLSPADVEKTWNHEIGSPSWAARFGTQSQGMDSAVVLGALAAKDAVKAIAALDAKVTALAARPSAPATVDVVALAAALNPLLDGVDVTPEVVAQAFEIAFSRPA